MSVCPATTAVPTLDVALALAAEPQSLLGWLASQIRIDPNPTCPDFGFGAVQKQWCCVLCIQRLWFWALIIHQTLSLLCNVCLNPREKSFANPTLLFSSSKLSWVLSPSPRHRSSWSTRSAPSPLRIRRLELLTGSPVIDHPSAFSCAVTLPLLSTNASVYVRDE